MFLTAYLAPENYNEKKNSDSINTPVDNSKTILHVKATS